MALDGACSEEEFAASDTFEKVCEPLIKNPRMRAPRLAILNTKRGTYKIDFF